MAVAGNELKIPKICIQNKMLEHASVLYKHIFGAT